MKQIRWRRSARFLLSMAVVLSAVGCFFAIRVAADPVGEMPDVEIRETAAPTLATELPTATEPIPAETEPAVLAAETAEVEKLAIVMEKPGIVCVHETDNRDDIQQLTDFIAAKALRKEPEEVAPAEDFRWLSVDDLDMLARIAMSEVGGEHCKECAALVIRVVINRVKTPGFSGNVYYVLHTPGQFTPVDEGTFDTAVPNSICWDALWMVLGGWDESQGALFYESCTGPSWHSQNLELLYQHCNTRFYK